MSQMWLQIEQVAARTVSKNQSVHLRGCNMDHFSLSCALLYSIRNALSMHTQGGPNAQCGAHRTPDPTMKKIILIGLRETATEADICSWLSGFGTVSNVELVRDGDVTAPVAVIEMDISDGLALNIVSRISRYWHGESLVSAYLLHH